MAANFLADVRRQFIVDVGRQLSKNMEAAALLMSMAVGVGRWLGSFLRGLACCHESTASATGAICVWMARRRFPGRSARGARTVVRDGAVI